MTETLRILWMNWRDIRHPLAGGAEVYTHEVAKRLAAKGHEVVLATSRPRGLPPREEIEGYTVVRRGGRLTVYLEARRLYRELRRRGWRPDVVVDEINTVPFMTPLYVEEPIVVLIHQLCRDCWSRIVGPLQPLAWRVEKQLHRPYIAAARRGGLRAVITVSETTRADLLGLGYPGDRIHIVLNGLDWARYGDCGRHAAKDSGHVVYMGRIAPYKLLEELLQAWRLVEERLPEARLTVAGRPEPRYLLRLLNLTQRLGLRRVEYRLNIPEDEKRRLLSEAGLLVYTSKREGWGIGLIEAAACRTPAIAYDVPGLRDAARYLRGVRLVPPHRPEELAEAIREVISDPEEASRMAEEAYANARRLSWDATAQRFEQILIRAKAPV